MKYIRLIARDRIVNPGTGKVYNDDGLRALNGYFENVYEVEDSYNKVMFLLQIEEEHPELKGWNFQIIEID